jgi:hypothetical protein
VRLEIRNVPEILLANLESDPMPFAEYFRVDKLLKRKFPQAAWLTV